MSIKINGKKIAGFPIFDEVPTENSPNGVTSSGVYSALSTTELIANKVIALSSAVTDDQYPSALSVWTLFNSITNANEVSY